MTEDQFQRLLSIVDRHAGRKHSADGSVARALREVLAEYERMTLACDDLEDVRLPSLGQPVRKVTVRPKIGAD